MKLVSEAGVGRVAAGVAKAFADYVLVAGHAGGTGRLAALVHQARGLALGARPRRDAARARRERAEEPDRGAGGRRAAHGAGRRDRGLPRRRGVRLRDGAARRRGVRDGAAVPPEHLPDGNRDAAGGPEEEVPRDARDGHVFLCSCGRGRARAPRLARRADGRRDRGPRRPPRARRAAGGAARAPPRPLPPPRARGRRGHAAPADAEPQRPAAHGAAVPLARQRARRRTSRRASRTGRAYSGTFEVRNHNLSVGRAPLGGARADVRLAAAGRGAAEVPGTGGAELRRVRDPGPDAGARGRGERRRRQGPLGRRDRAAPVSARRATSPARASRRCSGTRLSTARRRDASSPPAAPATASPSGTRARTRSSRGSARTVAST